MNTRALHNEHPPGSLEARDLEALLHPSTNLKLHHATGPTVIERGEGIYVWDNKGKQYIEGMAGLWCTALGYGEDELADVAAAQMKKLNFTHLFGGKSHEPAIELAEKLKAMAPFDAGRVFFGNSGSDANDTQIKLAWYYNNAIGRPDKKKIIGRWRGYHGVTIGAGSLTGLVPFHQSFDLPLPQMRHAESPHYYREGAAGETEQAFADRRVQEFTDLIAEEGADTIAAFIAEPVMGAGGVITPPADYLARIADVCAANEIIYISDEVITGFGRTGQPFGVQTYDVTPTTMSVAKALSSAYLPISAVLLPEWMYEPIVEESGRRGTFGHGFTYSGHPVCSAVALRNLEIFEERDLFAHAARVGDYLQQRLASLADHPLVGEVRGVGLIAAVELVADKQNKTPFAPGDGIGAFCSARCQDNGAILRNLGDSVAFCPPLIITNAQVDELVDKFTKALDATLTHVRSGL